MRLFHTTDAADAILRDGFRDSTGSYLFVGITLTGVFLADVPVDVNEGARGNEVLEVILDEGLLTDHELVQAGAPYREWCVPAALIARCGSVRRLAPGEVDNASRWLKP